MVTMLIPEPLSSIPILAAHCHTFMVDHIVNINYWFNSRFFNMSLIGTGVSLCKQAQEIVQNVWSYFQFKETEDRSNGTKGSTAIQNTMAATGIKSRTTIHRIRKFGPQAPVKRGPKTKRIMDQFDDFSRSALRRLITTMYEKKKWPTIKSIHEAAKSELGFVGSASTLRKILKSMGYKYSKRPERLVKERPDIVAKRYEYLTQMKKIRELKVCPIFYLDETFLNTNHTKAKCWVIDGSGGFRVPTGKGGRLIILHAGSKDGFVPDALLSFESKTRSKDYHEEMNGEVFLEWFKSQFLPGIPPNSCIVMDNASYHSVRREKLPTLKTRKADMQEWLSRNNIRY